MDEIESEKQETIIEKFEKMYPEAAHKSSSKLKSTRKKLSRKQKKYREQKVSYSHKEQLHFFSQLLEDTFFNRQKENLSDYILKNKKVLSAHSKEYIYLKKLLLELASPLYYPTGYQKIRQFPLWDYSSLFNYIDLFNQYRNDFKYFDQVWDADNPHRGNENQLENPAFLHELAVDKMEREWQRLYRTYLIGIFFVRNDSPMGEKAKEQLTSDINESLANQTWDNLTSREVFKQESPDNLVDYNRVLDVLPRDDRYDFHKSFENAKKILDQYTPFRHTNKMNQMDEDWLKKRFKLQNFYLPEANEDALNWREIETISDKLELALANKTIEFALVDKKVALLIAGFLKAMASQSNHWQQLNPEKKATLNSIKKMRRMLIQYYLDSSKINPEDIQRYFVDNFRGWWD